MSAIIREWRLGDAEALAAVIGNKAVLDNLRDGIPYPYTVADAKELISATLAADKDRVFAFAVEYEGRLAGSVGIYRCDNIHYRTAEVGYYIGEPFWGRGSASSAVRSACDYVFENTDIIRLFAEPFAYNAASCRVLEKSGFQLEGLLRSNAEKNGRILDMKMYSRIK